MTTQSEVLEAIARDGFYSARIYENGRSTRGSQDVSPAQRLEAKGILVLMDSRIDRPKIGSKITHYTWVRAIAKKDP